MNECALPDVWVPSVSVIIPTYNRVHCLPRALESVLRQTYEDIEVIVVDDCSGDETEAYLATVTDPRLRVMRHEANRGGAAARNTGINAARAPIIAFQDSDDEWLVTKLARQIAELETKAASGFGAVYCGKVVYGKSPNGVYGSRLVTFMPPHDRDRVSGDLLDALLQHALISTQTLVVRKDLLERIKGFDEELKIGQDWDLTLRLARETKFAFVEEPLVMTFIMPDSISKVRLNAARTWQKMLEKNYDLVSRDKRLHARNLAEIGRIYQRAAHWKEARPFFVSSIRVRPANRRAWAGLVLGFAMTALGRR